MNSDSDRAALKDTITQQNISWRSWWDQGRIDGPIHTTWQVLERPAIHLLDGKGIIRYKNLQPQELDEAIEKLLAKTVAER